MLAKLQQLKTQVTFASLFIRYEVLAKAIALPCVGIIMFIFLWQITASNIVTSLGQFPGPGDVWSQSKVLVTEHYQERDKAQQFYQRQEVRNTKKRANNPEAVVKIRQYTGQATYFDKIITSLYTVAFGFFIATINAATMSFTCTRLEKC